MNYSRIPLVRGSALVTTLLVIAVLTIIVTAFLQSMSLERKTARSYLNRFQAELAAEAGATASAQMIRQAFTEYPDSVTWWDPDAAGSGNAATILSYYANEAATDSTKAVAENLFYLPLVSGAKPIGGGTGSGSIPFTGDEVDLNDPESGSFSVDGNGWIGSIPGAARAEVRAPWVYLQNEEGKRISRYAFWIEDETFRVNVNTAGAQNRGKDSSGKSPSEVPLQGALKAASIDSGAASAWSSGIVSLRDEMDGDKLHSVSEVNYAPGADADAFPEARFLLTNLSGGLNLSRTGSRRFNLNANMETTEDVGEIQDQLDRLKAAINYRPEESTAGEFDFGNRFYRNTSAVPTGIPVSDELHREIYVTKIAANIRDYIDTDASATQVLDDGSVILESPTLPVGDAMQPFVGAQNDFWAVGKENVPRITKTAMHVAQLKPMSRSSRDFDIRISYYLEFWNMGTKDIVFQSGGGTSDEETTYLDPSAFIRIGNQPAWFDKEQTGDVIPEDRPYNIPLSSFGSEIRFPAGQLTVLTTDPDYKNSSAYLNLPSTNIYVASNLESFQRYTGEVKARTKNDGYGGYPTLDCRLRPIPQDRPTGTPLWDIGTYVILADKNGILDSQRAAIPIKPGIFIDAFGDKNITRTMHFRGGTLPGNLGTAYDMGASSGYPSQLGDPRASTDPLAFDTLGTKPTLTRRWPSYTHALPSWRDESSQSSDNAVAYSILGYMRPFNVSGGATMAVSDIAKGTNPYPQSEGGPEKAWDDAGSSMDLSAQDAKQSLYPGSIAVVSDTKMESIGELGNIYDPAFYTTESFTTARGGGRTLRVGQSDQPRSSVDPAAQWDGQPSSASRARAAWRLCDIFSTQDGEKDTEEIAGLININGVQRDNGAAVRAALEGLLLNGSDEEEGEPEIDGKALQEDAMALTDALVTYIQDKGPLRERGELSELPLFNTGTSLAGVDMASAADRSREQLFRRLVEMTTTRGNYFTAYVVGQALRDNDSTARPHVLATVKRKVTFRLIPKFDTPLSDQFDPNDQNAVNDRFSSPTDYEIQILRVTE